MTTPTGAARKAWTLAREHRDDTGVIFVASFPALDSLVEELARYMARGLAKASDATRTALLAELKELSERLQAEQAQQAALETAQAAGGGGGASAAAAASSSADGADGAARSAADAARLAELTSWLEARQADEASRQAAAAASGEVAGGYEFNRKLLFKLLVMQHGQSGRLGEAIAGHHGLVRLHLKARGCPPHS